MDKPLFRSSFSGYNRSDVNEYILKLSEENDNVIKSLRGELEKSQKESGSLLKEMSIKLEKTQSDCKKELEAVNAKLAAAEKELEERKTNETLSSDKTEKLMTEIDRLTGIAADNIGKLRNDVLDASGETEVIESKLEALKKSFEYISANYRKVKTAETIAKLLRDMSSGEDSYGADAAAEPEFDESVFDEIKSTTDGLKETLMKIAGDIKALEEAVIK